MYVKINSRTFGNKRYDYAFLVRARWTPKGSRHEVVHNFGRVSGDEGERLKRAFQLAEKKEAIVAERKEFKLGNGLLLAPVMACERQWAPLGLEGVMGKKRADSLFRTLVFNRCVDPRSKIAVTRWYPTTALPALLGLPVSEVNKNTIYPILDLIDAKHQELEERLYRAIDAQPGHKDSFVYIDWTTSYFEGSKCELAAYGCPSKDHRPDRKQVMLSLAIKNGYPFAWNVYPGNASEVKVFEKEARELKARFGLKEVTFCFDRGPVSDANLKLLEDRGVPYITALDKPQIRTHVVQDFYGFIGRLRLDQDYQEIVRTKKGWIRYDEHCYFKEIGTLQGRRYILAWNPEIFHIQRLGRDERLAYGEDFLRDFKSSLKTMLHVSEVEKLMDKVHETLIHLKVEKYYKFEFRPTFRSVEVEGEMREVPTFEFCYSLTKDAVRHEERLDGLWCLATSHITVGRDRQYLRPAIEIIRAYRNKHQIEAAFRHVKDSLEIRPIYVHKPEHVRAHYTLCVLAYAINKRLENLAKNNRAAHSLFEELDSAKLGLLKVKTKEQEWQFPVAPDLSEAQIKLLRRFDIEEEEVQSILTCDFNRLYRPSH